MILRNTTLKTPLENILFDELLLQKSEQDGGEVLRFWESSDYFIVLGRIGKEQEEVVLANVREDNIPVFRRSSGGGTVLQGPGCLNYTLILDKDNHPIENIKDSYKYILGRVINACQSLKINAQFFPISDMALLPGEKKFSGNAQKRGRKFILHHGTILYRMDIKKIEKYLAHPKDQPDYRQERRHTEFLTNVSVKPNDFREALAKEFSVSCKEDRLLEKEQLVLSELATKRELVVEI